MHRVKEKLRREIAEIGDKPGGMSRADLEVLNGLTDALKDLEEISAMEDEGGYSEARRHYVRAHYSRDGWRDDRPMNEDYSGARRDRRGRYSGDDSDMRRHIEAAMAAASPEDREMLERMLNKMQ